MKNKARGWQVIIEWLAARDRKPFLFHEEAWKHDMQANQALLTTYWLR